MAPLVDDASGLAAQAGSLTAEVTPGVIAAGAPIEVDLNGTVPARPGRYRATLDLRSHGAVALSTPLRVDVAASAFWGVVCLVFGLSLLGVVNLLTGEGGVEEATRNTLRDLGAIHAEWDRNPPPASRAETAAAIERNYDAALRALARPRGLWITDRRVSDAKGYLALARAAADKLSEAMTQPPGALEASDLIAEWETFKAMASALSSSAKEASAPANPTLASRVASLIDNAEAALVARAADAYVRGLEPQVERVKLALAAGEDDRARAMALAVRQWKRRAADDLEKRQTTIAAFAAMGANMLALADRLREVGRDTSIPKEARDALSAKLEAADAALASGLTLKTFAEAYRQVEEAQTQSMRDEEAVMLDRVKRATEAAAEELSLPAVDAVFAGAKPQTSPAERAAVAGKAFEAWRQAAGVVRDDAARAKILLALDAGAAAAAKQDLAGVSTALRTAHTEWQAYAPKHVAAAGATAAARTCDAWRNSDLREIAAVADQVRMIGGAPEAGQWEKQLDAARVALLRMSATGPTCLGELSAAYGDVFNVSRAVFQAILIDSGIPMDAELDSARLSGDAKLVALVQRLMTEPRDLKMNVATPEADRVIGQPVQFRLDGIDPAWGSGVDVAIDWDDRTDILRTDAERLRQAQRIEHSYRVVGGFAPTATARLGDQAVGKGQARLIVAPAPAGLPERLADIFLTAQFWLALLIASVVYYWRFHSGTTVFGAEPLHYVQAFALGFVAYAAVADLPRAFAELMLK